MIRSATLKDAENIVSIYNYYIKTSTATFEIDELSVEDMQKRMKEIIAYFPFFVCEEKGKIVGYCYAHQWKSRAAYATTLESTIYVSKDAVGKGIGFALMSRLIQACKSLPVKALVACITGNNVRSILLHSRLGFQKVSHFKKVGKKMGHWLDIVDMELIFD